MFLTRIVPLGVLLTATACTHADILRLDQTLRPQKSAESVQLIAQEPQRPYTVIAIVSVRADLTGLEAARKRLVKEAAGLGGDAVLLDTSSVTMVGSGDSSMRQLTGKVIAFN